MLNKFPSDKINLKKMYSFFFCKLQFLTVLLLIHNSYTSRSTMFTSLKLCVGFPIFESVSFLLKFIFSFNKKHELKRHNSLQNKNNRKITHSFAARLQQQLFLNCNNKFEKLMKYTRVGAPQKFSWSQTF